MKYLISTTETYRVDSEKEAKELIEQAKSNTMYSLSKYTCTYKERKQRGEVVDAYYKVVLTKVIDDEKEPYSNVIIIINAMIIINNIDIIISCIYDLFILII